jgi:sulfonate transport system permease protein
MNVSAGTVTDEPGAVNSQLADSAVAGTNFAVVELRTGAGRRRRRHRGFGLIRVMMPIALLLVWQVSSDEGLIGERTLPPVSTIFDTLRQLIESGELQTDLRVSLWRAAQGLFFGLIIGIAIGIIAGLSRLGEQVFDSTMQMLRTVPFIALVPLFLVWFGIGEKSKIILIAAACTFPVYLNTYAGVRHVDPKLVEAGRVFGLSRRELVRRIVLPGALPNILVGVRYAAGTAVLALVLAEQINATNGIGYLIFKGQNALNTPLILAGVFVYAVLGLAADLLVRLIERFAMPWRTGYVK